GAAPPRIGGPGGHPPPPATARPAVVAPPRDRGGRGGRARKHLKAGNVGRGRLLLGSPRPYRPLKSDRLLDASAARLWPAPRRLLYSIVETRGCSCGQFTAFGHGSQTGRIALAC